MCLENDAYYVGTGDYIDFLSPSNRERLVKAGLYETAMSAINEKALELMEQVYDKFLAPTTGRWIGMVEGHHFAQGDGETTDEKLCEKLKTTFLGTSAFVRIPQADFTMYVHHGTGAGKLPGTGLNRLYHVAAGLQGADVYLLGHDTKLATTPLSRPFPIWGKKQCDHRLESRKVYLVNCGGFSKSNIVGHRVGAKKEGCYAEKGLMTPSPLSAPLIRVNLQVPTDDDQRIRVEV